MATGPRFARKFTSAVLGLALLSLVFLGSPGCGCGDDDLGPPEEERPERCCCTFEWLPPRIALGDDVVLTIENADVSLDAEVNPALFPNLSITVPVTFTVCVNQDHLLGDTLDLSFRDQVSNEEYTRVQLIYDTRCEPVIEPLSDYTNLRSTDCGEGEPIVCCCEFEWRPGPNQVGDVTVNLENVSAGLDPYVTPTSLSGVGPDAIEILDVCVDVDHPLGATMDLVIRQQGSGALVGAVRLTYDERCTPTVTKVSAAPTLNITSTECGGEQLECCCEFDWLPPVDFTGNVSITAENASAGMTVIIAPNTINGVTPRTFYNFAVCINADHNLLDSFELVITDTTGPEILRSTIVYRLRCEPDFGAIQGPEGQQLGSTDCGTAVQCCCQFEWILTDPDFNPPPSPWSVSLENVDGTLEPATVTPTSIEFPVGSAPTTVLFEICVNPNHTLGAAMELVIRDPTGLEMARLPMDWTPQCRAQTGDPSGAGQWINLCETVMKPGR